MTLDSVKTNKDLLRLQFLVMMQDQLRFAFYSFIEHHPFSLDVLEQSQELKKSYYDSYCDFSAKFAYGCVYDENDFFTQLQLLSAPAKELEVALFFKLNTFNETVRKMLENELNKRVSSP